jgi:IS5 family transposase
MRGPHYVSQECKRKDHEACDGFVPRKDFTDHDHSCEYYVDEEAKRKNTTKARVRAKVEHPFRILKRVFGFTKVRYRGIWKNHQWLCAAFAPVNLYQHRNRLASQRA